MSKGPNQIVLIAKRARGRRSAKMQVHDLHHKVTREKKRPDKDVVTLLLPTGMPLDQAMDATLSIYHELADLFNESVE